MATTTRLSRAFFLLTALAPCACGASSTEQAPASDPPSAVSVEPPTTSTGSSPVELPPDPPDPLETPTLDDDDAREVGRMVNGLAVDMLGRLASSPGNLVFSPASIEAALAMTAAGARGETSSEMQRVLHLAPEPAASIDRLGRALRAWDAPDRAEGTLQVANRLFGERTYTFDPSYLAMAEAGFGAPLEGLDFRGASDAARGHINSWVAEQTHDRIRDLLPPPAVNSDTRLVLVNAVYLDARWERPFEQVRTRPATFTLADGTSAQVATMHARASRAYGVVEGATVVELPYRGGELAMRFILPPPGVTPEAWASTHLLAEASLTPTDITLALPKFRIEPGEAVSLREHLTALGMPLAFDRAQADFTGIASPPTPGERLYVSDALHKAFIRVDEEGTEAAAATAIAMGGGAGVPPPPALQVSFDRPFLFALREVRSGAILFLGRVSDPR